jgi:hypothetical protein
VAAIVLGDGTLLRSFLQALFGCSHRKTTFPVTTRNGTWVTCLDCGKRFPYDWQKMKIEIDKPETPDKDRS